MPESPVFHGWKAPKSGPRASIFALNHWTEFAFHHWRLPENRPDSNVTRYESKPTNKRENSNE
jgi:hypothetical protein